MASINRHAHRLGSRSHTNKRLGYTAIGRHALKLFTRIDRQEVRQLLKSFSEDVVLPKRKTLR